MSIRENLEQMEEKLLAPGACLSSASKGRLTPEEPDEARTCYMRDRDRIIHSKAFRRLKHKTQVFLSPEGDHYRTRLTHTLEVSQLSRTIAKSLRLNEDLAEAIALGHDLGHTPFGHAGERALDEVCPLGFSHSRQSLRVVDSLEKDGRGLNLSWEVRDGILWHSTENAATLEGKIVRFCDKIAYINHDIDDAVRAGVLAEAALPERTKKVLGMRHSQRLGTLVRGMVDYQLRTGLIGLDPELYEAMEELHEFLFENVYRNPVAKSEEKKGVKILQMLYAHYTEHPEELPVEYEVIARSEGPMRAACDYIAGMTDRYAVKKFEELFVPRSWSK